MKSSMSIILIVLAVAIVGLFVVGSGTNGSRNLTGNAFKIQKAPMKTCFDPDYTSPIDYSFGESPAGSVLVRTTTTNYFGNQLIRSETDRCFSSEVLFEFGCAGVGSPLSEGSIINGAFHCKEFDSDYVCFNGACIPEDEVPQLEVHPSVPTGNRQVFI